MVAEDVGKVSVDEEEFAPTCRTYKLSISSLSNVSIFEIVEADNNKGLEHNPRIGQYSTSDCNAFINVLKSSLGSGLLAMPNAFMNAGLLVGVLGTLVLGTICAHCTYILVKSSQELCSQLKKTHLNYPDTAECSVRYFMKGKYAKYAGLARKITNVCIVLPNYGVGIIYVLLAAATFKQILEGHIKVEYSIRWYILAVTLPLLPVGTVRQMKYMMPFSALANVFLLIGVTLTMYYTLEDLPPVNSRPLFSSFHQLPLFLSTVLFGMEGIGVILPIENSMKTPQTFLGLTGIFNSAMSLVVVLSVVMGFFGYIKYGDAVQGSITLNLPDTFLAELVKVLVAVAILCTYGLQVMAAAQVFWRGLQPHVSKERESLAYYTMRVFMIMGHIGAAILVPQLSPVISLIGAIGLTMLGFAIPAIIETLTFWEDGLGFGKWILWKNIFLWFLALFTLVSGTWVSCVQIREAYA